MKKLVFFLLSSTIIFFSATSYVEASLLMIDGKGGVQLNVLSAESDITLATEQHDDLQIDKIADTSDSGASIVKLDQKAGKFNMEVYGTSGLKTLDVTGISETIVEIEERPQVQKLEISVLDGRFNLKNKGTIASTMLPITVDSRSADLTIKTESGEKILAVYPYDAVQSALRTNLLTSVNRSGVEIIVINDNLQYKIDGEKTINLFDIYRYSIPVSSYISGTTGKVLKVDAPGWLKFINVLFA